MQQQSVRMVSNSANAPFSADKLWSLKDRVALVTGRSFHHIYHEVIPSWINALLQVVVLASA